MIWLILSVLSSSIIFVIFRLLPRMQAHTFPAIVINYMVAAACGLAMLSADYSIADQLHEPWIRGGLLLGTLFITLFYLMAFTAQRVGVGVTSIATKMSLVIPVAWFMLTDPNDAPTALKIAAVVLAVIGVVLSAKKEKGQPFNWAYALFPVIIFMGSGIIDLVIGHFSQGAHLTSANDQYLFTAMPFLTSSAIGLSVLLGRKIKGLPILNWATLGGGIVLGLVNFGSIFFLVRTFEAQLLDRSAIIPINNLGVVLLTAFASLLLFRERLTPTKSLGLALSVAAILLLAFSKF
jgi:drug/metabolite transporter (DMT)-like permease